MTVNLSPTPYQRFVDSNGNALSGGLLYTYAAGTTTPQATYTDSTGGTPNQNPIVLNTRGEASIWLDPTLTYKYVLQTSGGATIWTQDNISPYVGVNSFQGAEAQIASAATTDIGSVASAFIQITGTTTITSFGVNYKGPKFIRFAGAVTLTYNASSLILPGGANITTVAGDTCVVAPVGNPASGWQVVAYQKNQPPAAPTFSAYQSVAQTLPNTTITKIQLQSKEWDTSNAFDATTNYRFQPTTPGYYLVTGALCVPTGTTNYLSVQIHKNGSSYKRGDQSKTNAAGIQVVSAQVQLNGSTDYVELYGAQDSGAPANTLAGIDYTYFQAVLVSRP